MLAKMSACGREENFNFPHGPQSQTFLDSTEEMLLTAQRKRGGGDALNHRMFYTTVTRKLQIRAGAERHIPRGGGYYSEPTADPKIRYSLIHRHSPCSVLITKVPRHGLVGIPRARAADYTLPLSPPLDLEALVEARQPARV